MGSCRLVEVAELAAATASGVDIDLDGKPHTTLTLDDDVNPCFQIDLDTLITHEGAGLDGSCV